MYTAEKYRVLPLAVEWQLHQVTWWSDHVPTKNKIIITFITTAWWLPQKLENKTNYYYCTKTLRVHCYYDITFSIKHFNYEDESVCVCVCMRVWDPLIIIRHLLDPLVVSSWVCFQDKMWQWQRNQEQYQEAILPLHQTRVRPSLCSCQGH